MSKDQVTLTVPARGEYARTVRMTAAELATRMEMTFDEVEDVRMAVEEAFVYACESVEESAVVTFVFTLQDGELSAEVGPLTACGSDDADHRFAESYAELILKSLCDDFSIEHEGSTCTLRLTRRVGASVEGAGD